MAKSTGYPKTFKKGDVVRVADTIAQERALRFDGFKLGGQAKASTPSGATGAATTTADAPAKPAK